MDRPSSAPSTPSDADLAGDTPEVVGVDSDEAEAVISALSSETARELLACLHDAPDTHSGLADRLDTTIQTVEYHLSNLQEAGLVEVDGVTTSETGQEMDLYAPADGPLVVLAADDEDDEGLRATLRRTLGGVGVLALASLVVDRLLRAPGPPEGLPAAGPTPTEPSDQAATGTPTPGAEGTPTETVAATGTPTPTPGAEGTPTETVAATDAPAATGTPAATSTPTPAAGAPTGTPTPLEAADPGLLDGALATSPGLVFFLGGLLGILVVVALTHRRRLRWWR